MDFLLFVDNADFSPSLPHTKLQDNQKVVIVVNAVLEDSEKTLLSKILKAIKVDMEREATVLVKGEFSGLKLHDDDTLNYLLLGVEPDVLQLQAHLINYQSVTIHNNRIIMADPISVIGQSDVLKRQLWTALQTWL